MSSLNPSALRRRKLRPGKQNGFTMLECVIAILIVNLTIVAMFRLLQNQEKRVVAVEQWVKDSPVLFVNPDPDPIARILGQPASLDLAARSNFVATESMPFEVRVLELNRELAPARMIVVFEVFAATDQEPSKPDGKSGRGDKGGSGSKSGGQQKGKPAKSGNSKGKQLDGSAKDDGSFFRIHKKTKKHQRRGS